MSIRRPPVPFGDSWKAWADQIYRYLAEEQSGAPTRRPVALAHLTPNSRASQDGLLLWDATNKRVVVSRDGEWRKLAEEP